MAGWFKLGDNRIVSYDGLLISVVVLLYLQFVLALLEIAGSIYLEVRGPTDYVARCANISTLVAASLTWIYPILHHIVSASIQRESPTGYRLRSRFWRKTAAGILSILTLFWTAAAVSGLIESTRSTECADTITNEGSWNGIQNCQLQKAVWAVAWTMIVIILVLLYSIGLLDDIFTASLWGLRLRDQTEEEVLRLSTYHTRGPSSHRSLEEQDSMWSLDHTLPKAKLTASDSAYSFTKPNKTRISWLPPQNFEEVPWEHPVLKGEASHANTEPPMHRGILSSSVRSNKRKSYTNPKNGLLDLNRKSHMTIASSICSAANSGYFTPRESLESDFDDLDGSTAFNGSIMTGTATIYTQERDANASTWVETNPYKRRSAANQLSPTKRSPSRHHSGLLPRDSSASRRTTTFTSPGRKSSLYQPKTTRSSAAGPKTPSPRRPRTVATLSNMQSSTSAPMLSKSRSLHDPNRIARIARHTSYQDFNFGLNAGVSKSPSPLASHKPDTQRQPLSDSKKPAASSAPILSGWAGKAEMDKRLANAGQ